MAVEPIKYHVWVALLPLYTRLRREAVLDNFVRGQIHGYVHANPGDHYGAIKRRFRLGNGMLAYHLDTLEREGYLQSIRDGRFKRFYPAGTPVPSTVSMTTEERIIERIGQAPGISQQALADALGLRRQTIAYHARFLESAGAIRMVTRRGRARHWLIEEDEGPVPRRSRHRDSGEDE